MALGDCSAGQLGVESGTMELHGVAALHSADCVHRRNAAAALLDGGDPWLPAPAEF